MRKFSLLVLTAICFLSLGCIPKMGSGHATLRNNLFEEDASYSKVRSIIIEEARNNGFGKLVSEIKPSIYNGWSGKMDFRTNNPHNTADNIQVKFKKNTNGYDVIISGIASEGDVRGASAGIQARLSSL